MAKGSVNARYMALSGAFALVISVVCLPSVLVAQPVRPQSDGPFLLEVRVSPVVRQPSTAALLSVRVANAGDGQDAVKLRDLRVVRRDGKTLKELPFDRPLSPIGRELRRLRELEDILGVTEARAQSGEAPSDGGLDDPADSPEAGVSPQLPTSLSGEELANITAEYARLRKKVGQESVRCDLTLDVLELDADLKTGDVIDAKVEVELQVDGATVTEGESLAVAYESALPSLAGWHVGDGHMHSSYSDGADPIWAMAQSAQLKGLSWVAITDHDYDLALPDLEHPVDAWDLEKAECEGAEASVGIPVILGEELGVSHSPVTLNYAGHYLAYGLDSFYLWSGPGFNLRSSQAMIDDVNERGGFGFIAHPYDSKGSKWGWKDWSVTGYTGLEVMSGGRVPPRGTSTQWDANAGLGGMSVGMGGSDAHDFTHVGSSRTYCLVDGPLTGESILQSLRSGRTVSSNGPLVTFQIGDSGIGDTVVASPGQSVTLDFSWASTAEFGNVTDIWVQRDGDRKPIDHFEPNSASGTLSRSYPAGTTHFRVYAKSVNGSRKAFYAYTSPIFVKNWSALENETPSGLCWRWTMHPFGWAYTSSTPSALPQATPGDHVRAYLWVRKPAVAGYVNLELYGVDANGALISPAFAGTTVYPWYVDWVETYADGIVPEGAAAVRASVQVADYPSGIVDFDAFRFMNYSTSAWTSGRFEGQHSPFSVPTAQGGDYNGQFETTFTVSGY